MIFQEMRRTADLHIETNIAFWFGEFQFWSVNLLSIAANSLVFLCFLLVQSQTIG